MFCNDCFNAAEEGCQYERGFVLGLCNMLQTALLCMLSVQTCSMQCISSVLQQEEELRHPALTPAAAPGSPAVLITNGSFAWEAGGIPLLRHISLEIPAGRLLIVIGEVGSGERSAAGVGAIHIAYTSGIESA